MICIRTVPKEVMGVRGVCNNLKTFVHLNVRVGVSKLSHMLPKTVKIHELVGQKNLNLNLFFLKHIYHTYVFLLSLYF